MKKFYLFIILFLLTFSWCDKQVKNNSSKIDTSTVIKIDSLEITQYEFDKNLNRYKKSYLSSHDKKPGQNKITRWKKKYLDERYLLSYLYKNDFDQKDFVILQVNSMARRILTQRSGLVEKYYLNKGYTRKEFNNLIKDNTDVTLLNNKCKKFLNNFPDELVKNYLPDYRIDSIAREFQEMNINALMQYDLIGTKHTFTVKDFFKNYNSSVLKPIIYTREDLNDFLRNFVRTEYIMTLADSLGLQNKKKFQLNKKNYKNKTMNNLFENKYLWDSLTVEESEIKNYYKNNKESLSKADTAIIDVFRFDSLQKAKYAWQKLAVMEAKNDSITKALYNIPGLQNFNLHTPVTRKTGEYPKEILYKIFSLEQNRLSEPLKVNNSAIIIYKLNEKGTTIPKMEEVKKQIINKIKKNKIQKIENKIIAKAKNKYKISQEILPDGL